MKKTFLLLQTIILSAMLTVSFVSAGNASFVASIQGAPIPVTAYINDSVSDEVGSMNTYTSNLDNEGDVSKDFTLDAETEQQNDPPTHTSTTTQALINNDPLLIAKLLIAENKNIITVDVSDSSISVTRGIPSKLFWFIPVTTKEIAQVVSFGNSNKEVMVSRPWWNLFSKENISSGTVSDDLTNRIKTIPPTSFTASLNQATQAQILSVIGETFTSSSNVIVNKK